LRFKKTIAVLLSASSLFGAKINFADFDYFVPSNRLVLKANIDDDTGIFDARVYFKQSQAKIFQFFAPMKCSSSKCVATIPIADDSTAYLDYILMFQNNQGDVFKTKIFQAEKRDMIELPSWQIRDISPIVVKSELKLLPKDIRGFKDNIVIKAVEKPNKLGVIAQILTKEQTGVEKPKEDVVGKYKGRVNSANSNLDLFNTKTMLIGAGAAAGLVMLTSSGGGSGNSKSQALTPNDNKNDEYNLGSELETPLVKPEVSVDNSVDDSNPPLVPSKDNTLPNTSDDYVLTTDTDTAVDPNTNEADSSTTTSNTTTSSLTPPIPTTGYDELLVVSEGEIPTNEPVVIPTEEPTTVTPTTEPTVSVTAEPTSEPTSTPTTTGDVTTVTTTVVVENGVTTVTNSVTTTTQPTDTAVDTNSFSCGESISQSQSSSEYKIDMKKSDGYVSFNYNMGSSRDRMIVYYENSMLYESGCVALDGDELSDSSKKSPKGISFNGTSNYIDVEIKSDCENTGVNDWSFSVSCP